MSNKQSDLTQRSFKRILLVKPSSLGDVVHALPILNGLRERYPDARIDWLVSSAFAPLLQGHDLLNEVIKFDRQRYNRLGLSPSATRDFFRLIRKLRANRYDLAIDLQGLLRSGFTTWASGAKVRIGFRRAREGATLFYSHFLECPNPDAHAVDKNYQLAEVLGFAALPIEFPLPEFSAVGHSATDRLAQLGSKGDSAIVAIAPGARWATKRWAAARFAETIDRIEESGKARCILLGGPDEKPLCDRIAGLCRLKPTNFAGETSLPELVALLKRCDLVLCHDSAVAHIAVALEKPLVCLIGPTHPGRTGPYRRMDDVIRIDLECAPCYLRKLSQCPHDHRCMKEITVNQVTDAVITRLASTLSPINH